MEVTLGLTVGVGLADGSMRATIHTIHPQGFMDLENGEVVSKNYSWAFVYHAARVFVNLATQCR